MGSWKKKQLWIACGSQIGSTWPSPSDIRTSAWNTEQMSLGTEVSLASCSFTVASACPNPPTTTLHPPAPLHFQPSSPRAQSLQPPSICCNTGNRQTEQGRETDRDPFTANAHFSPSSHPSISLMRSALPSPIHCILFPSTCLNKLKALHNQSSQSLP